MSLLKSSLSSLSSACCSVSSYQQSLKPEKLRERMQPLNPKASQKKKRIDSSSNASMKVELRLNNVEQKCLPKKLKKNKNDSNS